MKRRQLSLPQLQARRAALDALAATRPLTAEERAERDNLADRLYHRVWRAQQREAEMAQRAKLQAQIAAQNAARPRRHAA